MYTDMYQSIHPSIGVIDWFVDYREEHIWPVLASVMDTDHNGITQIALFFTQH